MNHLLTKLTDYMRTAMGVASKNWQKLQELFCLITPCASYAAAKTHDIPRVSMWLGHTSSNMTEKHYREGVRAAEGEAWFNIFPEEETK